MRFGWRLSLTALLAGLAALQAAPAAPGAKTSFVRIKGVQAAGTPAHLNKVGILKVGPARARNVLVLNPGTSSSAAYFRPLADQLLAKINRRARRIRNGQRRKRRLWQVWAVERRENILEDHSVFDRAKVQEATPQEVFDYYLRWLEDPSISPHFSLIPDEAVPFARNWGMSVQVRDLRRVVLRARRLGGKVVLGGHSLGGSITTAYATWDFAGRPGGRGLAGLLYIDGGSNPEPISEQEAQQQLADLQQSSPWRSFGGIPSPFTGLFNTAGSLAVLTAPDAESLGQDFSLLPNELKPPCNATNLAQYGYALDTETSPPGLAAAQAHLGRLDQSTDPCGWDRAGEITPIRRYARIFSGVGLRSLDGTAWYHPLRLTIDSGAVAAGRRNPAQRVLGVRAIHGDDLRRGLRIYAFAAALGGGGVLRAARFLAGRSGIPRRHLTLVNRAADYSHNDPNSAFPINAFVRKLIPFLRRTRAPRP